MTYEMIDRPIERWAERHDLKLFTSSGGGECRGVFVSSKAGGAVSGVVGIGLA